MNDRYVFGLIDPRDYRIFFVGTLASDVPLKEYVADAVAAALAGQTAPPSDRVQAILAADYDAPHAVILQPEASAADEAAWIERLEAAGNPLTNVR
jgi:hypothetical protein